MRWDNQYKGAPYDNSRDKQNIYKTKQIKHSEILRVSSKHTSRLEHKGGSRAGVKAKTEAPLIPLQ